MSEQVEYKIYTVVFVAPTINGSCAVEAHCERCAARGVIDQVITTLNLTYEEAIGRVDIAAIFLGDLLNLVDKETLYKGDDLRKIVKALHEADNKEVKNTVKHRGIPKKNQVEN